MRRGDAAGNRPLVALAVAIALSLLAALMSMGLTSLTEQSQIDEKLYQRSLRDTSYRNDEARLQAGVQNLRDEALVARTRAVATSSYSTKWIIELDRDFRRGFPGTGTDPELLDAWTQFLNVCLRELSIADGRPAPVTAGPDPVIAAERRLMTVMKADERVHDASTQRTFDEEVLPIRHRAGRDRAIAAACGLFVATAAVTVIVRRRRAATKAARCPVRSLSSRRRSSPPPA
ncbi:hypothetical protein AB0J80_21355 [Actinoplanes sp. NPDC049548]|uniref:hypothetical protein n=1 Tax=Actinoplanes sp. NPDC049548 TaxID=3155152 RepID=UPI00341EEF4F